MLKFHSVFLCLMVIMFNRDQAALLSLLLINMCHGSEVIEHRDKLVSRGDSVILTCNRSETQITQITWTKGTFVHSFLFSGNQTFSNFTSDRLRIDNNSPSTMNISNVQHDDAGTYRCCIFDKRGTWTIKWNLNVSGEAEETSPLSNLPYILTAVIGFLLVTAVGLYSSTKFPNQLQERETLSYVQFRVYSGEEVHAPLQPHSCAEYRTNHKHVGTSRGSIQYVAL
ncbi:uncharacterized protein LOC130204902 isoform X1 [Pseudoliparis swirei]|uniref:uncharacterized protein LOC130204902 isoform X1 n=1 Tax=Pseudoliparis swirei TaxID=2059687 RepID=UPI0024BD6954|nr:uncharacterized protein LOC130204902 isoform X1 [Pseudoliparis swirei]